MKKIIIKIGSSTLMTQRGKLDEFRIAQIAKQITLLKEEGFGVVLVVSGAVACGIKFIHNFNFKKAAAGIGQVVLVAALRNIFNQYEIEIAQILLTKKNLASKKERKGLKELLEFYMNNGFISVINENDVVDLNSFGGNDYLAAEVAKILGADRLLILSLKKKSSFGVGGWDSKCKTIDMMRQENIQADILNGKEKDIILQTVL